MSKSACRNLPIRRLEVGMIQEDGFWHAPEDASLADRICDMFRRRRVSVKNMRARSRMVHEYSPPQYAISHVPLSEKAWSTPFRMQGRCIDSGGRC